MRASLLVQVLKLDSQMLELAEELKTEQSLLVFGRGYNYATALEAALKVRSCRWQQILVLRIWPGSDMLASHKIRADA